MMAVDGDVIQFPKQGELQLGSLLGHGANSSIFYVRNKPGFVVKAHHSRSRQKGELDVRFSSETKIDLSGPGFCIPIEWTVVHDDERNKGQLVILFKLLKDYIHLEEAITNIGEYSEQDRFVLSQRLALLLFEAHEQGWLHGDLQPRNIMFHPKTLDVQLIDFEWALTTNHDVKDDTPFGVDDWMAPELLFYGRKSHSIASEVWAFAKIVLSLLAKDAASMNRKFRSDGNENSISDHITTIGEKVPLFEYDTEIETLRPLFSCLSRATIPDIKSRVSLAELISELDRVNMKELNAFQSASMPLEVICPEPSTALKVNAEDFEIEFCDHAGSKFNVRIGRNKRFLIGPLDIEIKVLMDSPAHPRIQVNGATYPLTTGFTVRNDIASWVIRTIEVLK
tara:strand:+ start:126 stop:1310 length:1185 start_codon:yes stop_codon:yes gene_type:complete